MRKAAFQLGLNARNLSVNVARYDIFTPSAEHAALRSMVRDFAREEIEPQALTYNREERFNSSLFKRAGELGLLGVTADPEYGGSGLDATAVCIVHEELAAVDPAFCLSYLAHSLLFVNNLNVNGSDAQRARYLPKACSGEFLCGMAMSEPGAGTDVLGMSTTAERKGGQYVLNGRKMWITNGAYAPGELGDAFLMYAKDSNSNGGGAKKSHSLFLVDKGMPGFSLGQIIKEKCGMRASNTTELVLDNVHVPAYSHVVSNFRGYLRLYSFFPPPRYSTHSTPLFSRPPSFFFSSACTLFLCRSEERAMP